MVCYKFELTYIKTNISAFEISNAIRKQPFGEKRSLDKARLHRRSVAVKFAAILMQTLG